MTDLDPKGADLDVATLAECEIRKLLERKRRPGTLPSARSLDDIFGETLRVANQFVPSLAGSIVLDDPLIKRLHASEHSEAGGHENELVFVACFGEKADPLVGTRLPATRGIIGKTYRSGRPFMSADVSSDADFYGLIDRTLDYRSDSIICAPIHIELSTCGVIELINRCDGQPYSAGDLQLLGIFAKYISLSLEASLDAGWARELAKLDDLTGLYNDRYFHHALGEALEDAQRHGTELSVLFLDLDCFKTVNDTHGHLVGSQTLRAIGAIISRIVEEHAPGAIAARYGGDEFVVVLGGSGNGAAMAVAERIRLGIETAALVIDMGDEEPGIIDVSNIVTASIGVSTYHQGSAGSPAARSKDELIRIADRAMYSAKSSGKNRVINGDRG